MSGHDVAVTRPADADAVSCADRTAASWCGAHRHLPSAASSQLSPVVLRPGRVAHRHVDADHGPAVARLPADRLSGRAGHDQLHRPDPAAAAGAVGRLPLRPHPQAHRDPGHADRHADPGAALVGPDVLRHDPGVAGLRDGLLAGRASGGGYAGAPGLHGGHGRGQRGPDQRHRPELGHVQRRARARPGAGGAGGGGDGRGDGLFHQRADLRGRHHQPADDAQPAALVQAIDRWGRKAHGRRRSLRLKAAGAAGADEPGGGQRVPLDALQHADAGLRQRRATG